MHNRTQKHTLTHKIRPNPARNPTNNTNHHFRAESNSLPTRKASNKPQPNTQNNPTPIHRMLQLRQPTRNHQPTRLKVIQPQPNNSQLKNHDKSSRRFHHNPRKRPQSQHAQLNTTAPQRQTTQSQPSRLTAQPTHSHNTNLSQFHQQHSLPNQQQTNKQQNPHPNSRPTNIPNPNHQAQLPHTTHHPKHPTQQATNTAKNNPIDTMQRAQTDRSFTQLSGILGLLRTRPHNLDLACLTNRIKIPRIQLHRRVLSFCATSALNIHPSAVIFISFSNRRRSPTRTRIIQIAYSRPDTRLKMRLLSPRQ